MGKFFSKPKAPVLPDPAIEEEKRRKEEEAAALAEEEKERVAAGKRKGRSSTIVSNKPLLQTETTKSLNTILGQ